MEDEIIGINDYQAILSLARHWQLPDDIIRMLEEDLISNIGISELKKERVLKEINKLHIQDKKNRAIAQSLAR